ncbi:MAG: endonuclease domain-containing protein [Nitrospinae bacterium]|nr:endonuclease domain-containing protein [Nitrospinota bacterium]
MRRNNIERCRNLRKNQTDAEKKLWTILRNRQLHGVKFRRQFSIGRYILDFYSPEYRLSIEADGGQHYEDKGRQRDDLRTRELNKFGVEIVRFNDREILTNIEGIYEIIKNTIEKQCPPSPQSSPQRGEEVRREEMSSGVNDSASTVIHE